ncbi:hypothetical protein D1007_27899 [Hordeum vulgare]|nr:hypothetical protein D1007_27899 [Hordeum vulgare]
MNKKQVLRHSLTNMSQAAENFDSSLMVALFDAKLLFVLNEFDVAEGECRRELRINTPNDPSWDDIPPMAVVGGDSDARVSYVKKQLRVFLEQTILGLNSSCDGNKFLDFLWQNMCSKHPDELLGKLQSVIDPEYCESLLLSPSVEIQAEPFVEIGQRKCREGSEILLIIREKLRMLPEDTLSTEECYSMRKRIPSYLNHPRTRHIGFADANIDIICGTSDQSVKEIASTSSIQQSLNVSNKHNADKELSVLSVSVQNTVSWSLDGPPKVVSNSYRACIGHYRLWNILSGMSLDTSTLWGPGTYQHTTADTGTFYFNVIAGNSWVTSIIDGREGWSYGFLNKNGHFEYKHNESRYIEHPNWAMLSFGPDYSSLGAQAHSNMEFGYHVSRKHACLGSMHRHVILYHSGYC